MNFEQFFPAEIPEPTADLALMPEFARYLPRFVVHSEDGYYNHQKFVQQFMSFWDKLVVIHDPGTGKTKTALSVLQVLSSGMLKNIYRNVLIVVTNAQVEQEWRRAENTELTSLSGMNIRIIKYLEFSLMAEEGLGHHLFILDEVHTLTSSTQGTRSSSDRSKGREYENIRRILSEAPAAKVILLSGTPMQNHSREMLSLMQLMEKTDLEDLRESIPGKISLIRRSEDVTVVYGPSEQMKEILREQYFKHPVVIAYLQCPVPGVEFRSPSSDIRFLAPDGSHACGVRTQKLSDNRYRLEECPPVSYLQVVAPSVEFLPFASGRIVTTSSVLGAAQSMEVMQNGNHADDIFVSVRDSICHLRCELPSDWQSLRGVSSLYYGLCIYFASSCSLDNRRFLLSNDIPSAEVGKSIFFMSLRNEEKGGVHFLGLILKSLGWSHAETGSETELFAVRRPRFCINPGSRIRKVFNDPANWDGGFLQLVLFTGTHSKGVNFTDVRHIHLIPWWSPSENCQAIYRGIRAHSHDNLFEHLNGSIPIRVYYHTSHVHPGLANLQGTTPNEITELMQRYRQQTYCGLHTLNSLQEELNGITEISDNDGVHYCPYSTDRVSPLEHVLQTALTKEQEFEPVFQMLEKHAVDRLPRDGEGIAMDHRRLRTNWPHSFGRTIPFDHYHQHVFAELDPGLSYQIPNLIANLTADASEYAFWGHLASYTRYSMQSTGSMIHPRDGLFANHTRGAVVVSPFVSMDTIRSLQNSQEPFDMFVNDLERQLLQNQLPDVFRKYFFRCGGVEEHWVHFLYHLHPTILSRRIISPTSPLKIQNASQFVFATQNEKDSVYKNVVIPQTEDAIAAMQRLSNQKGFRGYLGILDTKIYLKVKDDPRRRLEALKVVCPGASSTKQTQGRQWKTLSPAQKQELTGLFGDMDLIEGLRAQELLY